jgi:hypothetical protein
MSEKREFSIKVTVDGVEEVLTGKSFILVVDDGMGQDARIIAEKGIDTIELVSGCVACGAGQLLQNDFSTVDVTFHMGNAASMGMRTAIDEFKGGNAVEQIATDAH